ncbi:MAG: ribonuclease E/G, partial [Elusimicrobiota bacterium]
KVHKSITREAQKAKKRGNPAVLYEESDVALYTAREFLDESTEVFLINDKKVYRTVRSFVKKTFPELASKVKYYSSNIPLFERYKIEHQIDSLRKRTINLDCGGYIIIEQTEALTAIDVNTGSYTSGESREKTALKVNKEAACAAVSQIVLRDIGGIIIIDFIDLNDKKNKKKLLDLMKREMVVDKARFKIFPMTRLGIIQMTRQRRKESIVEKLCRDCPYCGGSGMIFSEVTMYIKVKRELLKKGRSMPGKKINLFIHPRVAEEVERKGFESIEKEIGKKIVLRRDYKMHHEEYKIC